MNEIIRIPLLGYVILLIVRTVVCEERTYRVKVVGTVNDDPLSHGSVSIEIDSRPQINIKDLEKDELMDICKRGAREVRKHAGIFVKVLEKGRVSPLQRYALHSNEAIRKEKGYKVELVDACHCPTDPPLYFQIHRNGDEQVVTVIVEKKEARPRQMFLGEIQYELKSVTDVSVASTAESLTVDVDEAFDPDDYTEDVCLQMCEDALDTLLDKSIRWWGDEDIGEIKFYRLDVEGRKRNPRTEIVQGFQCPTSPPTYVTIPQKVGKRALAWLIVEERNGFVSKSSGEKEKPPVSVSPRQRSPRQRFSRQRSPRQRSPRRVSPRPENVHYEYELKAVKNIVDVTIDSSREVRLASVTECAIDPNKLSEEQRLRMCRRALREVEYDYRFVTFLHREKTEPSKFYALHSEVGERLVDIVIVEAFRCPTKPSLFIHINEQRGEEGLIWVVIKDRKAEPGINGATYNMEVVKDINEASPRDATKKPSDRQNSAIDTDDMSEEERRTMCRKGIKLISGRNVDYLEDSETGLSKLYSIEVEESKKKKKNSSEAKTKRETVRAYKCPTEPDIYLEVQIDSDFDGYSVRVLVRESDLEDKCEDTCYQIKFIDSIVEVSESDSNVFKIWQLKSIDTDEFKEEKRMEMCEKAIEIDALKKIKIKFIPKTETGPRKIYAIEVQGAPRKSKRELVEAFKCPTKPSVYIQVLETEDKKELVWVLFNKDEPEQVKFCEPEDDPRLEFCKRALGLSSADDRPVGSKSKYYLMGLEISGSGAERLTGKDVLKAIKCPTRPSLKLELYPNDEDDEDDDDDDIPIARPAFGPRGSPLWLPPPVLKDINYKVKNVLRVTESFRSKSKRGLAPIDELPEDERYQMCNDAARKVFGRRFKFVGNEHVGETMNYQVHYDNRRSEFVQAFKCATKPPIFLEVIEDGEDAYTIWILVETGDLALPGAFYDEMHYEVIYVTEVSEATPREVASFERRARITVIDSEEFSEDERYQMCKHAAKVVPGRAIKFKEKPVGETRYYTIRRLDSEMRKRNGKLEVVKAFECPTRPELYLQYEEEGNDRVVSVIVKRIPPVHEGIRGYKLKFVRSVEDVDTHGEAEYEVQSFLPPEELDYDEDERQTMCHDAEGIIPNAHRHLKWLEEEPGEEKFYAIEIEYEKYISREIISAFACPTHPPFYLQTYVDKYFTRSVWVIVNEKEFYFVRNEPIIRHESLENNLFDF